MAVHQRGCSVCAFFYEDSVDTRSQNFSYLRLFKRMGVCVAALSLGFSTGLFVRWPMTFSSDMFATAVGTYLCGCSDACKAIVIVNHFPLLLILYKLFYCFTSRILLSA